MIRRGFSGGLLEYNCKGTAWWPRGTLRLFLGLRFLSYWATKEKGLVERC